MGWGQTLTVGPPIHPDENEFELKMAYAAAVAKNPSRWMMAGYDIFRGMEERGRALQAQSWYYDPDVQAEIERLKEPEEVSSLLPSDEQLENEILNIARDNTVGVSNRLAAYRLAFEARGKLGKGTTINNNNNNVTQAVMVVPPTAKTDDERVEYLAKFKRSQMKLVSDARSKRD